MTARDHLVERVALAMTGRSGGWTEQDREPISPLGLDSHASIMLDLVREVLEAAYPQITTVEELAAVPECSWLIGQSGYGGFATYQVVDGHLDCNGRMLSFAVALEHDQPLTLVWQPEAGDRW